MKILLIMLWLASASFGQSIQDKVKAFANAKTYEVDYDKFQKKTSVRTAIRLNPSTKSTGNAAGYEFYISMTIYEDGTPPISILMFSSGSRYPRYYSRYTTLRLLADDRLIEIKSDSYPYTAFVINKDHWETISTAKVLELQLNSIEGVFDEPNLTKLRHLASLIQPPPLTKK